MQEKLIIYLHADNLTQLSWAVVDTAGEIRQSAYKDQASGLAQIAENKQVIVIVPAEDVLLTTIKLPPMNHSRLLQAIPYALEDQLVDEVENLHFAVGERQNNSDLFVAVVSHTKMQQWKAYLQTWDIIPDILLPLTLALPCAEQAWYAVMSDVVVVRMNAGQGFVCDVENFTELFHIAVNTITMPQFIYLQNFSQQAFHKTIDAVTVKETFYPEDQIINYLARTVTQATFINLLQGPYIVKKSRLPQINKQWKIASYLAIFWTVILFCYPIGSYFILHHRLNEIEAAMTEIYKHHFPQASSAVAPKQRMEGKLRKLNEQADENRSLLLLSYVGSSIKEMPSIKINRLDFQNNQLTLDITTETSQTFSSFTTLLNQQGLTVKQQNADLLGSKINATLLIE